MRKSSLWCLFVLSVVCLFGLAGGAQAANVPAGDCPYTVLAVPVHHEVFVANMLSDNITVIDSTNDTVETTIDVTPQVAGGIGAPVSLAYNPNTDKLYCVNFWSGQLLTIDRATKSIESSLSVGYGHVDPRAVVVNPDTNIVYFSVLGQGMVYAVEGDPVDPNYNKVIASMKAGQYPRSLAVNTNLGRLYAVNAMSGSVSVFDINPASPTFHQLLTTVSVGTGAYGAAFNHSTGKLYVTLLTGGNVAVVDAVTNTNLKTVKVGANPRTIDVNPETNLIYVANQDSGDVSVLDGASDTVVQTIPTGVKPRAVAAIRTADGSVYVANYGSGTTSSTVTGIDSSFNTSDTIAGRGPYALSIDTLLPKPKVFAANYVSRDVTVIDPPVGASSLVTSVDPLPGDVTADAAPVLTGTSTSMATPFPHKITKVYYLLDSADAAWSEARITSGAGTPSVTWEIAVPGPLAPGSHSIRVFAMDVTGATVTSSDGGAATPSTGMIAAYGFTYRDVQPASISGVVFDDANASGVREDGEAVLSNETVTITLPDGSSAQAVTDVEGRYRFADLTPGTHAVAHDFGAGWLTTSPSSVTLDLGSGQDASLDFGAIRLGSISGTVTDEYTKAPVANALITLAGTGRSATTGADGTFAFVGLVPNGTALMTDLAYTVQLGLPAGYATNDATEKPAVVAEAADASVSFTVYKTAWTGGNRPRGRGFWKHWKRHYSAEETTAMLADVKTATGLFGDVTADGLRDYLSMKHKGDDTKKKCRPGNAEAQHLERAKAEAEMRLMVAWLNVVSGRLGVDLTADVGHVHDWKRVISTDDGPKLPVARLLAISAAHISGGDLDRRGWETLATVLRELSGGKLTRPRHPHH